MSFNISGNESGSSSAPVQTPQSEFALQISQAAAAAGSYLTQWAQQVYAQTSALTSAMVTQYLNLANYGQSLALNQMNTYETQTVPEMNQLAGEAADYSSTARLGYNMGAAESDAAQNAGAANQNTLQSLRSYGVDPSSGMYGDILAAQNTAAGASEAGAAQEAQVNTENEGRTLLNQSITAGETLPGDVVNALNSAYQGVSGAENSVLSNANTGAAVNAVAAPYFNAAASAAHVAPATASRSSSVGGSVGGGSGGSKQPATGQMGRAMGNPGPLPGGGPAAASGGPGTQMISNPFYQGPNLSDNVDPTGGGFNEFGGTDNPEASLANDPFNQEFTQYQGDTTPYGITNPSGGDVNDMTGASFDQYNSNPGSGWGDFSTPSATNWSSGATNSGFGGSSNGSSDSSFDSGTSGFNSYGTDNSLDTGSPAYDNFGNSGGYYNSAGGGGSTSGGAAAVSASGDSGDWGGGASPVTDYGGAGSDFAGGYYARGGSVQRNFRPGMPRRPQQQRGVLPVSNATTGGHVPMRASPSMGQRTDDVAARLNAGEFVIPKDVAAWKGQEFFQNLINQSRKKRVSGAAPAQGKPKPALNQRPTFTSRPMGMH